MERKEKSCHLEARVKLEKVGALGSFLLNKFLCPSPPPPSFKTNKQKQKNQLFLRSNSHNIQFNGFWYITLLIFKNRDEI